MTKSVRVLHSAVHRGDRVFVFIALAFVGILLAFGGASRFDEFAQVPVRLAGLAILIFATIRSSSAPPRSVRWPAILLTSQFVLIAFQLVPLPPGIWTNLPGRSHFIEVAPLAGFAQTWRPLSISPDLTINSLLSVIVPASVLAVLVVIDTRFRDRIGAVILVCTAISLVAGIFQLSGGADGSAVYRVLFKGQAPGLFANRNHQALFLALSLPVCAATVVRNSVSRPRDRVRAVGAVWALAVFIVLLATGSRTGLVAGALCAAGSWLVIRASDPTASPDHQFSRRRSKRLFIKVCAGLATTIVLMAVLIQGRTAAVERLANVDPASDLRVEVLPTVAEITWRYFPFGSGFGTFDPAYRIAEPDARLAPAYLNQAHNDLLQFLLEGGVFSLAIAICALFWLGRSSLRLWRAKSQSRVIAEGRAATVALGVMVVASALDYPLRTPIMMALAAALVFQVCLALDRLHSDGAINGR